MKGLIKSRRRAARPSAGASFWAALVLGLFVCARVPAQTATIVIAPDADSFVRSLAPTSNYGAGGALSVSGPAAVNGAGEQNGSFDALMRFPMSNVVAYFDSALSAQDWILTEVRLAMTEMAAPDNSIFNRGVGGFEVRWIAWDEWMEGTGKPSGPTSDGVTWQDLPLIVNTNVDVSLGVFTNSGANGPISANLALAEQLIEDLRFGGQISLHLKARSPQIGFTFSSRNFGNTNAQPALVVRAAANPRPRIDTIGIAGTTVSVSFGMASNWTYRLQWAGELAGPGGENWSNLLTLAAQSCRSNVIFLDEATIGRRFYRLSVSP